MNRDDVIRLAREAGEYQLSDRQFQLHGLDVIARFAELVRADERNRSQLENAYVQAEREACAKLCETLGAHPAMNVWGGGPDWYRHGKDLAKAIRARGFNASR